MINFSDSKSFGHRFSFEDRLPSDNDPLNHNIPSSRYRSNDRAFHVSIFTAAALCIDRLA
jgi:hypothetical protein